MKFSFQKLIQTAKKNKFNFILAIIPLILSVLLFWFHLWPAWQQYKKDKALIAQKKLLIERYQQKIKVAQKNLEKEPEIDDPRRYLFQGRDPYIIVSEIQKKLEKISGLYIRSFSIVDKKSLSEEIEKIEILFNMEGDIKSLTETLLLLEGYKKALRIKLLQIFYQKRGEVEKLRIVLRLEALFLKA